MRKTRFNKVFWGCSGYPKCTFVTNNKPIAQQCSCCGYGILFEKRSKKGIYYYCTNCKHKEYK
jgi:ssDNA-binding Zn-finger/Zn-ribbon topoisomerase 1